MSAFFRHDHTSAHNEMKFSHWPATFSDEFVQEYTKSEYDSASAVYGHTDTNSLKQTLTDRQKDRGTHEEGSK